MGFLQKIRWKERFSLTFFRLKSEIDSSKAWAQLIYFSCWKVSLSDSSLEFLHHKNDTQTPQNFIPFCSAHFIINHLGFINARAF